jgi:hypothetical protein
MEEMMKIAPEDRPRRLTIAFCTPILGDSGSRHIIVMMVITLCCNVLIGCGAQPSNSLPANQAAEEADEESASLATEWDKRRQVLMRTAYVPDVDAIDSMSAEAYGHPVLMDNVGPFVVPRAEYENILKHLRKSEIHTSAWTGNQEVGTIRIDLKGGTTVRYCWFWMGKKGRLSFSYGGIRYRTIGERFADDETLAIDALIREIHARTSQKDPGK